VTDASTPDPLGWTPARWEDWARAEGLERYRARQIFDALHREGRRDFRAVAVLPRELRERLAAEMPIALPEIVRRETSRDGSVKYGLRLADGALIEAVFMPGERADDEVLEFDDARSSIASPPLSRLTRTRPPQAVGVSSARARVREPARATVCLSSQTGCAVDCVFCVTGRLGGGRNLSPGEILGQLYAVLEDSGRGTEGMRVVFMGMGEPLLNLPGLLPALEVLFEIVPPRRVTVSTSGITPALSSLAALPRRPNLAVSINAADEETRSRIMPINRTYPLAGLIAELRRFPLEPRRRILAEYVLIAGVNDTPEDARRLAALLAGIPVKINVIPLNEDPVYLPDLRRPSEAAIDRFVGEVADAGAVVTVRRSKGPDTSAACGQLKGRTQDIRRRRA
jgi:23S rRNA (adenine2503-C2)-methyltransferase